MFPACCLFRRISRAVDRGDDLMTDGRTSDIENWIMMTSCFSARGGVVVPDPYHEELTHWR